MIAFKSFFVISVFALSLSAFATKPNATLTPGVVCTPKDPDFSGFRYKEKIAVCARNISHDEKLRVAQMYENIPESTWKNYEFDHLIPVSAGGSNDIGNLWPQPIIEAHQKDIVEDEIFRGLEAGTMTQAEGIQKMRDWIKAH